ncbi:MAG: hypothetical protein RBR08_16350 [Desulforegulaceae bacterium]|nr:hypothetical protein [Desulforegulaceae bacterium]
MRKTTLYISVLSIIFTGLLVYSGFKLGNAYSRIEDGIINEMWLKRQRDFLVKLPALMLKTGNKESLLRLLKDQYPNTEIIEYQKGILFPPLLLEFDSTGNRIVNIRKLAMEKHETISTAADDS